MLVDRAANARSPSSPRRRRRGHRAGRGHETPEKIITVDVNFMQGLQAYQCRKLGFAMGLGAKQTGQLAKIMMAMFNLFR